jgi:hypothetical protein
MNRDSPVLNEMNPIMDWNEILSQISGSQDAEGPLHVIQSCLTNANNLDPYDQIDKQLDLFIENLKIRFQQIDK